MNKWEYMPINGDSLIENKLKEGQLGWLGHFLGRLLMHKGDTILVEQVRREGYTKINMAHCN